MNSITMHIFSALVDAAMKRTTLGCLSAVITRTCVQYRQKVIRYERKFNHPTTVLELEHGEDL